MRFTTAARREGIRAAFGVLATIIAACGSGGASTAPTPVAPTPVGDVFPGIDLATYPGDAAMQAWKNPASPYYWVGYYLPAPCHRDSSWNGKRATLASMGWGMAAIYVGQQDWTQSSNQNPPTVEANATRSAQSLATCSAALLSADQGAAEASDAVAQMKANGFPDRSVIFLDVEGVKTVTPELTAYFRAWIDGVLADAHYRPGVYASKANAPALYDIALPEYHGARDIPPFWITSSAGFSTTQHPADVGIAFAQVWQGLYNASQTFGGVTLTVDVNVAASASPGTP